MKNRKGCCPLVVAAASYDVTGLTIRNRLDRVCQANCNDCPISRRLAFEHRVSQPDVAETQAAMPEQDRFVVVLAARLPAGHDLAKLRM